MSRLTDALERVCAPSDLTLSDRGRLRDEVAFAEHFLRRISRGSGFVEDRGGGWGADNEKNEGSERVLASLRAWPLFRRLLPGLRHYRHEPAPIVAQYTIPLDDPLVAELVLTGTSTFTGRHGQGWDEWFIEVDLGANAIRIHEETMATTTGGQPLSAEDTTVDYAEPSYGRIWTSLQEKLGSRDTERAAALARRMRETVVPCDTCGQAAQSYRIEGATLVMSGVRLDVRRDDIPAEALLDVRKALAAQDMPALATIDPTWVSRYRAEDDASYCDRHAPPQALPHSAGRIRSEGTT